MNISMEKLLTKMEAELQQARASQTEEGLRERIYSIKILCELILDEKQAVSGGHGRQPIPVQPKPIVPQPAAFQQPATFQQQPAIFQQQPAVMPQPKKLEMDDDANGDSLFDF
ncbi:YwdI family protein [Bacillus sp. FJAT-29814]|uniref:YwdI family protein n=1 Tax=Bacillus sp. FJAT-29814 TaxID=1729688 RepID=UPI000833ECA0|nr:YwdI family protein [Bacillus sp. FJAT-29814]